MMNGKDKKEKGKRKDSAAYSHSLLVLTRILKPEKVGLILFFFLNLQE